MKVKKNSMTLDIYILLKALSTTDGFSWLDNTFHNPQLHNRSDIRSNPLFLQSSVWFTFPSSSTTDKAKGLKAKVIFTKQPWINVRKLGLEGTSGEVI